MRTKAIIFDGKPGAGPEPETEPQPFGPETLDTAAGNLAAQIRENSRKPQPAKRGPGRPRKGANA